MVYSLGRLEAAAHGGAVLQPLFLLLQQVPGVWLTGACGLDLHAAWRAAGARAPNDSSC
jgi:hypothetical protein